MASIGSARRVEGGCRQVFIGRFACRIRICRNALETAFRVCPVVVLVAQLAVGVSKYPARHSRTVHVDAGIATQYVYLVATALGLGGCAVTGSGRGTRVIADALPTTHILAMT